MSTAPTGPSTDAQTSPSGRARRSRPPKGLLAVGVVLAVIVGYALWAGVEALRQEPVVGTVSRYDVRSATKVDYGLIVTGPAGSTVHCAIVARGDDYAIVGQAERKLTLDSSGTAVDSGTITTLRLASNAEAGTCDSS